MVNIYNNIKIMKERNKAKFDLMSQCLKQFKQMPQQLQSFRRKNSNQPLLKLVSCSNKFIQLANDCQSSNMADSQISLFYRFFSKLKDAIHDSLNYYLHVSNSIFVRDLLTDIRKKVMEYRPVGGYSALLMGISSVIVSYVIKIGQSSNLSQQSLREIQSKSQQIKIIKKSPNNYISWTQRLLKQNPLQQKDQNKNTDKFIPKNIKTLLKQTKQIKQKDKERLSTQSSLPKLLCYQIIKDIDQPHLQKLRKSQSQGCQELYRDCLNRNKTIKHIIRRFGQKYKIYQNKPQYRKNQNWPEYCPTTYKKVVPSRNYSSSSGTGFTNSFAHNNYNIYKNYKKRNISTSFEKRKYSKQRQPMLRNISTNSQQGQNSIIKMNLDLQQIRQSKQLHKQLLAHQHLSQQNQIYKQECQQPQNQLIPVEEVFNYDTLKQQIFNQIYAHREKLSLRKINIGGTSLHMGDSSIHERLKINTYNSRFMHQFHHDNNDSSNVSTTNIKTCGNTNPSSMAHSNNVYNSSMGMSIMQARTFRLYGHGINNNSSSMSNNSYISTSTSNNNKYNMRTPSRVPSASTTQRFRLVRNTTIQHPSQVHDNSKSPLAQA